MRKKLKLYVWEGVLVDYDAGIMCALATSVDQARELLLAECSFLPQGDLAKEPSVHDTPVAFLCWGGG